MTFCRSAVALVLLAVLALVITACGGDGDGTAAHSSDSRDAATTTSATTSPSGPGDAAARTSGGAFALSPRLATCIAAAKYSQDAPPTGGLVAWRGPDGRRAVIVAEPSQVIGVSAEIATAELPATTPSDDLVVTGTGAPVRAIAACLTDRS